MTNSDVMATVFLWFHLSFITLDITCSFSRKHFGWNHFLGTGHLFYKRRYTSTSTLGRKQVFQSPTTEAMSCSVLWIKDYWGRCYRVEILLLATAGGFLLRSLHKTDHKSVSARPHWKLIDTLTEELVTRRWCAAWSNQFNMEVSVFTWNWWSLACIHYLIICDSDFGATVSAVN